MNLQFFNDIKKGAIWLGKTIFEGISAFVTKICNILVNMYNNLVNFISDAKKNVSSYFFPTSDITEPYGADENYEF